MRSLWLVLALPACSTGTAAPIEEREKAALERELAGRAAGESRSCVSSAPGQYLEAVSNDTFVYRVGRTIWVNRPQSECRGMRPLTTLIIETYGSQYCRGDRVRPLEPGTTIAGPYCVLGDWTPYRRP
jgi:hypothetical protein